MMNKSHTLDIARQHLADGIAKAHQTVPDPLNISPWIAMSLLCGVYLIGLFRLPHDTPEDHVSVPRLLFSATFIGLALYLTPALFKVNSAGQPQRPGGSVYSWIDAFLLPDSRAGDSEIAHTGNLDFAVAQAREEFKRTGKAKRIFID